ncbi:MAG: DNA-directed RNA polymerase subunit beta [Leptolyngbya sp. PLA2]|nr:DNA-directed RNA polymerase subunit beta [Leptolyngbya sp.]MCE7971362.1 DNA-directed RNA polymerase subunit beta [Leptolyngbya sp. PL-A2]MCQ3940578.1 DNA-directed RNA polymerase subunit beta [cyanobacterium CYA1]MCZ7632425.1 DNA-directed RNA polymerase subunit beta [Phycisphaerales bacterium]MDL1903548.1 DNA-directed RNA polymerase subunit beta [Synechococcales cyanobacterium CNB]GIK20019.1 MAG: DNA-directed RNA polymerase subunit beta [Planctomycetota bacterium]
MAGKTVREKRVRNYSKRGDGMSIPDLTELQGRAYERFLQLNKGPHERDPSLGLEALLREVFPIESYDGTMRLEYLHYTLDEPRYTPDECRELRLTYGRPFRLAVRLQRDNHADLPEEDIFLGEFPIMMGGGEFIVNGAERVIVSQLHRSPGVDFQIVSSEGDRPLHSARIIPERGSWIELEVTKKDVLAMKIDQSTKMAATTFLRCLDESVASTDAIISLFYEVSEIKAADVQPEHWAAQSIIDTETGEEFVHVGRQIGDKAEAIRSSSLKKVRVVQNPSDELILNTVAEEKLEQFEAATDREKALLKVYSRLRPGNPPQVDKALQLFNEKFFDENRYRLGKVGRFRINRKFDLDTPDDAMFLSSEDYLKVIAYILDLRSNRLDPKTGRPAAQIDDIDHLGNRRLRTLDELAVDELRKGFLKLRRTVQERMSVKDPEEVTKIADLVNSKSISSAIDFFFGRSELSQVVDQTNPLSTLVHERRLSALGPGGLNRKRAGFEVRDVHISHYGRICPIETPEGTNIGLIASLGIFASVDEYGFLRTAYRVVKNGKPTGEVVHLRADEEMKAVLAPADAVEPDGKLRAGTILARVDSELKEIDSGQVDYLDISPKQIVGISAALIPFLEHDDANRALMGSNMQRQAVPLIRVEPPAIATGVETHVGMNSGMVVRAKRGGTVTFADAERIIIDNADEYVLRKFVGLNERTCLNQRPVVRSGQKVEKGQVIADGAATCQGELAIGKNVLIAFNTFDGYNFEDAIVISERLVKDDVFTSIHIDAFDVEIRETKLGREEFTRDIPNVSEKMLRNLDDNGVIRVGARVGPGDILVGKVSPKSKTELTPEEKLLHAIFGRAGEDVKNDSLEVPAGVEGIVIGTKKFSRRTHMNEAQKKQQKKDIEAYERSMDVKAIDLFREMTAAINAITGSEMVDPMTRQKVGASDIPEVILEQIKTFDVKWIKGSKETRERAEVVQKQYWPRIEAIEQEKQRKVSHMKRGDELPSGVLEMVKVYLASKRHLSVGDKMAGRHGNKGVIARIVPEEDMPFMEDGTPVDVLLNPLGVPSRMNVGQILELHLGWAAHVLGFQAVTPVFDGATEEEIHAAIEEANADVERRTREYEEQGRWPHPREILARMPRGGKIQLYDGRTGDPFKQRTSVGFMYLLKLHHLVDDKIHARATGPYSLITQQPLGGKARTGGQRFGEMEVWALEAYGAAYILQELLTVKSDDVEGRTKIYESMVKGTNKLEAGMPVAFDVLCNELKGLGMNVTLEKRRLDTGALL